MVLDRFDRDRGTDHELAMLPEARWYSEALLPSQFLPRQRGDRLAESFTHADGVIGHFDIKAGVRGDAVLRPDAKQFVVTEAKLGSGLSTRTTNAPDFDQAARNVACMAHMIGRAEVPLQQLARLGFYVIAPETQIEAGVFGNLVTKDSIRAKVAARIEPYGGTMDEWYRSVFEPVLEKIDVGVLSWESILTAMPAASDVEAMREFYTKCLQFNPLRPAVAERVVPDESGRAVAAAADDRPLCSECAKWAFKQWRGWCAYGLDDPPPVPDVPRLVEGCCPRCQATEGVDPNRVGYANVHGAGNTGLPDFFVLQIFDSPGRGSWDRWGTPYRDPKVGRVPLEELPKRYPPHGWRRRTVPFEL